MLTERSYVAAGARTGPCNTLASSGAHTSFRASFSFAGAPRDSLRAVEQPVQALVGLRGAIGVGVCLAPRLAGKLFGLDPDGNPQLTYVGRLFGVRDVALAYGVVTSRGPQRSLWLRIGLACDIADAAAGVLGGRRGDLPKLATVLVTCTAVGAAGLGIAALLRDQSAA